MVEWEKAMNVCFQEGMFILLFTYESSDFHPYTVIAFSCHSYAHGDAGQLTETSFLFFFECGARSCRRDIYCLRPGGRIWEVTDPHAGRAMYTIKQTPSYSNVGMTSGWPILGVLFGRDQWPVEMNLHVVLDLLFFSLFLLQMTILICWYNL